MKNIKQEEVENIIVNDIHNKIDIGEINTILMIMMNMRRMIEAEEDKRDMMNMMMMNMRKMKDKIIKQGAEITGRGIMINMIIISTDQREKDQKICVKIGNKGTKREEIDNKSNIMKMKKVENNKGIMKSVNKEKEKLNRIETEIIERKIMKESSNKTKSFKPKDK